MLLNIIVQEECYRLTEERLLLIDASLVHGKMSRAHSVCSVNGYWSEY